MELLAVLKYAKYLDSAMQHLSLYLIGVFEDEVFALLQLTTDVDHTAQDAPSILHAQVNLAGKLIGLELLCAKDDMPRRVLDMITGDVPKEKRTCSEKSERKRLNIRNQNNSKTVVLYSP